MKTIIKTSVKGNENVEVAETVSQVHDMLEEKGNYIFLAKKKHDGSVNAVSIRKSVIKMIVERS